MSVEVKEIMKLNREKINALAKTKGVAEPEKMNEKREVADLIASQVTPDELADLKAPARTTPEPFEPEVVDGIRYEYDGTEPDAPVLAVDDESFINLQESPAGYGKTREEALDALHEQQKAAGAPPAGDDDEDEEAVTEPSAAADGTFRVGRRVSHQGKTGTLASLDEDGKRAGVVFGKDGLVERVFTKDLTPLE